MAGERTMLRADIKTAFTFEDNTAEETNFVQAMFLSEFGNNLWVFPTSHVVSAAPSCGGGHPAESTC